MINVTGQNTSFGLIIDQIRKEIIQDKNCWRCKKTDHYARNCDNYKYQCCKGDNHLAKNCHQTYTYFID